MVGEELQNLLPQFAAELRLNPDDAGANAEIGAILVEKEEQGKGIVYLQKATRLEPDLWTARRELGQAYYMQQKFVLAEAELQQAIDHDSEGTAHYELGLVYRALGRLDDAKKMFARSREIMADRLSQGQAEAPRP